MSCNKYKHTPTGREFLAYSKEGEEDSLPPFWECELVAENQDPSLPENSALEIIHIPECYLMKRTRDKVLEDANIRCYGDLAATYFLIKAKESKLSYSMRVMAEQKYIDILDYVNI